MKCPVCQARLYVKSRYIIKGARYFRVPGVMRVYQCGNCAYHQKTLEMKEGLLRDLQQQFEAKQQTWQQERARLKQELYWLQMPAGAADRKLVKLREALIRLIEKTF